MTQIMGEGYGWIYVTICMDWHIKKVFSHHAGEKFKAWRCLTALHMALNRQLLNGARQHNLHLIYENSCQPTAISPIKACRRYGHKISLHKPQQPQRQGRH